VLLLGYNPGGHAKQDAPGGPIAAGGHQEQVAGKLDEESKMAVAAIESIDLGITFWWSSEMPPPASSTRSTR
jgi:hypothetical protein